MRSETKKLIDWIAEYVDLSKKGGVVIGLSGGVDSAVAAALAVQALGVERVKVVSLLCGGDDADVTDADRVSIHLGLGPITCRNLWSAWGQMGLCFDIDPANSKPELESAVLANMAARLRMIALYAEAQLENFLVMGTGNKSELMVGHITKWGDGGVDFEPLGEFYKTEVIEMARELGLPEDICTRTPTPGLREGVTDESEMGMSYETLDEALVINSSFGGYSESHLRCSKTLRKVDVMIRGSVHKRQMPPSFKRS